MATISKVYAKAIFELAKETNKIDQIAADVDSLKTLFSSEKKIIQALSLKNVSLDKKQEILNDLSASLNLQQVTKKFLSLLLGRSRIDSFPAIAEEFSQMQLNDRGVKTGTIYSPIELSMDELQSIQSSIEKRIQSKVIFDIKVNKKLLGGIVAKVDGKTFDASIKAQLDKFKGKTV
ncbi:MAG: ATP synthase F1 subunit delta [Oligoflexia bacterium]|nr:ATP synthase F1 subunit delta [Oligoflexia bacterium]